MSMTFAAVIWDADDPCSVNTAYVPQSSFTKSPRTSLMPLYLWYWGSSFEFLRWHISINDAKWTFLSLFLASSITSFWFLTFVRCHACIFSSFLCLRNLLEASGWICEQDCNDSENSSLLQWCDLDEVLCPAPSSLGIVLSSTSTTQA